MSSDHHLAQVLVPLRLLQHLYMWEDPWFTTWIYLALVSKKVGRQVGHLTRCTRVNLAIISTWQVVATIVCAIIPWHMLFAVIMHAIGLVVLGPHMHWVGRCVGRSVDLPRSGIDGV